MKILSVEFKAGSSLKKNKTVRKFLEDNQAVFKGLDKQRDTYFKCNFGRLKLREGNIENHLIQYQRANEKPVKKSEVLLYASKPDSSLKEILIQSLGILAVVKKRREIYFIRNVKFHLDFVEDLGYFLEIEALSKEGELSEKKLREQCEGYKKDLGIAEEDLLSESYSDMLIKKSGASQ